MVLWVVDELLSENAYPGVESIADAATALGHQVLRTKYVPFANNPNEVFGSHYDYRFNGQRVKSDILGSLHLHGWPTIVHGTIEFCSLFERHVGKNYTPGLYYNQNVKHFAKFAAYLGSQLLNDDFIILPFGEVCRRLQQSESIFIKPESGLKEFTGQVICGATPVEETLRILSPYGQIDPNTLCVVAQPKDIKAEFRYVIANRKVITGSEYRWDNVLDVRRDTSPICDALAKKVAEADWQADAVYICDVALLSDDTAKVIELNAFSSSGLYACDARKVVEAVSAAATKEFQGELDE